MTTLWACLTKAWGLNDTQAKRWWQALCASRWTRPVAWRRALVLYDQQATPGRTVDDIHSFAVKTASPRAVIEVIEELHREHKLTRQEASAIEASILLRVNRQGEWRTHQLETSNN